ncbi:MAG: glycosidase, partial [Ilumatobacteraceae bacterium]
MTLDVHQSPIVLKPDPSRVIARLFVAGREDVGPGDSRATEVIGRILALSDEAVDVAMRDLDDRFETRHRDLHDTFRSNADLIRPRRNGQPAISDARQLLIGAAFTHEYAIEGAALCNPSAVLHPQQDTTGDVRFVMSVRGIGEGHRSSIGFRTGTLAPDGTVSIDEPGRFPTTALAGSASNHRSVFNAKLSDLDDREIAAYI